MELVKKVYFLLISVAVIVLLNLTMDVTQFDFLKTFKYTDPTRSSSLKANKHLIDAPLVNHPKKVKSTPVEVIKKWKLTKEQIVKRYMDRVNDRVPLSSHDSVCKFPDFNPFASDGMKAWEMKKREYCTKQKHGKIVGNRLVIEDSSGVFSNITIEYILRGRQRKSDGSMDPPKGPTNIINDERYTYTSVTNDDFHVHFTTQYKVIYYEEKKAFMSNLLEHDFIRVVCHMKSGGSLTEYHATISNRSETCQKHGKLLTKDSKTDEGLPYNVHMFMVDAISQGNMYRQTPRLTEILENDEDAMVFRAHGIHGDGTTSQLMATLGGMFNRLFTKLHRVLLILYKACWL